MPRQVAAGPPAGRDSFSGAQLSSKVHRGNLSSTERNENKASGHHN